MFSENTAEEVLESDDYEQLAIYNDEYATAFINYHKPVDPCAGLFAVGRREEEVIAK